MNLNKSKIKYVQVKSIKITKTFLKKEIEIK